MKKMSFMDSRSRERIIGVKLILVSSRLMSTKNYLEKQNENNSILDLYLVPFGFALLFPHLLR